MIFAEIERRLNGHEGHVPLETMAQTGTAARKRRASGHIPLGTGALSAIVRGLAAFSWEFRPVRQEPGSAVSDAVSVFTNGGLQLGESLLHCVGAFSSQSISTECSNTIIQATRQQMCYQSNYGVWGALYLIYHFGFDFSLP
jgi:hypothetical protein